VLNKRDEQNNLTGSERGDPMFSRHFPSAKSLLGKQVLFMEPLQVFQLRGRCCPNLCCCGHRDDFWVFYPGDLPICPSLWCCSSSCLAPLPTKVVLLLRLSLQLLGGGGSGCYWVTGVGSGGVLRVRVLADGSAVR
jgi:hypothetical protein